MFAPKRDVERRRELAWIANNATRPPLRGLDTLVTLLRADLAKSMPTGLPEPVARVGNTEILVVDKTEHLRWVGLSETLLGLLSEFPGLLMVVRTKNTVPKITGLALY